MKERNIMPTEETKSLEKVTQYAVLESFDGYPMLNFIGTIEDCKARAKQIMIVNKYDIIEFDFEHDGQQSWDFGDHIVVIQKYPLLEI